VLRRPPAGGMAAHPAKEKGTPMAGLTWPAMKAVPSFHDIDRLVMLIAVAPVEKVEPILAGIQPIFAPTPA